MRLLLAGALSTGCLSIGGGGTFGNINLDNAPARRFGGHITVGNMVEVVEGELVGQLTFSRDLGPLGNHANALDSWGGRLTLANCGRRPGFYVHGAWGRNDEATQARASSVIAGAGIAYSRFVDGKKGRAWSAVGFGVVYHREYQHTVNEGVIGHFLGIELSVFGGIDFFGPMYARDRDNNEDDDDAEEAND